MESEWRRGSWASVTLGYVKVGLVGDMNLTSFRGSFFGGSSMGSAVAAWRS